MNDPQQNSPRARLQELLAIPERQRTDEQWDELNELEIMLAAGNREGAPQHGQQGQHGHRGNRLPMGPMGGHPNQNQNQNPNKQGGGGGPHRNRKQGRKFHQRPPKRGPMGS